MYWTLWLCWAWAATHPDWAFHTLDGWLPCWEASKCKTSSDLFGCSPRTIVLIHSVGAKTFSPIPFLSRSVSLALTLCLTATGTRPGECCTGLTLGSVIMAVSLIFSRPSNTCVTICSLVSLLLSGTCVDSSGSICTWRSSHCSQVCWQYGFVEIWRLPILSTVRVVSPIRCIKVPSNSFNWILDFLSGGFPWSHYK